jgi:hypothetical protein
VQVSDVVPDLTPYTDYQFRICGTDPQGWQTTVPDCADSDGNLTNDPPVWDSFRTKKLGGFMEGWFNAGAPTVDLLDAAGKSGAQIARFNVTWCSLEPTQNNFAPGAWNTTITRMKDIMANGMRPLPILVNAPTWARPPRNKPASGLPCDRVSDNDNAYAPSDTYVTEWKEFVSAFIACMKNIVCPASVTKPGRDLERGDSGFVPIQGYEIWNEPNLNSYWGAANDELIEDDADKFARMLRDSFDAANARGSTRPVVLGGLAFPDGLSSPTSDGQWGFGDRNVAPVRYLNRVYNILGNIPKFDAIAIHPYGKYFHTRADHAQERFIDIRNVVLVDHNDDQSDIWVTEVGDDGCDQSVWNVKVCRPNDFDLQSQRLVNMWTGPNSLPAPVIIYYRLMDSDFDDGRPMGVLENGDFVNPRPAYCALATQWGKSPAIC